MNDCIDIRVAYEKSLLIAVAGRAKLSYLEVLGIIKVDGSNFGLFEAEIERQAAMDAAYHVGEMAVGNGEENPAVPPMFVGTKLVQAFERGVRYSSDGYAAALAHERLYGKPVM